MDKRDLFSERLAYAEKAASRCQWSEQVWLRIDGLGWIYMEQRELDKAELEIRKGREIALGILENAQNSAVTDEEVQIAKNAIALADAFLARVCLEEGDIEKAKERISTALPADDWWPVIQVRIYLVAGDISFADRQYQRAIEQYSSSIRLSRDVGEYEAAAQYRLGFAYLALWDIDPIEEHLNRAEAAFSEVRQAIGEATTIEGVHALYGLASVAIRRANASDARALAQQASATLNTIYEDHRLLQEIEEFLARNCP